MMQILNASPRDHLTVDEVRRLLVGDRVEVCAGCEVLHLDLSLDTAYGVAGDITDDLVGGSVSRNMNARIHATCKLQLSTELPWGSRLVRPYMELSDGGVVARFYVGVFMLTTPERDSAETPSTSEVHGADRLYLLDREVAETYTVTSGTTYRAALVQVFTDAGLAGYLIDGAAADYTLPVTRTWTLVPSSTNPDQTSTPVTWLRIVNDLQQAWNGRGVWCDDNGLYRLQQYQAPSERAPEFEFDVDDTASTIVGQERIVVSDQWKQPNRWVFLWSNRPGGMSDVEGDGKYTYDLPSGDPLSSTSRGLIWPKVYQFDAASQAVLQAIGDRQVIDDRRLVTQYKLTTGPFPVAGHADIVTYVDSAADGSVKCEASSWQLDLLGGDMSWVLEGVS